VLVRNNYLLAGYDAAILWLTRHLEEGGQTKMGAKKAKRQERERVRKGRGFIEKVLEKIIVAVVVSALCSGAPAGSHININVNSPTTISSRPPAGPYIQMIQEHDPT
jgi:hypothetical protein